MTARESFGAQVRRNREAMKIGLREMAKKIGVSPTYLSLIERGDLDPPAEDKVVRIAEVIGRDPDELLARAGRVASDLTDIICRRPREMAHLLRFTKHLTTDDLACLIRFAKEMPYLCDYLLNHTDYLNFVKGPTRDDLKRLARLGAPPRSRVGKGLNTLLTQMPRSQVRKGVRDGSQPFKG